MTTKNIVVCAICNTTETIENAAGGDWKPDTWYISSDGVEHPIGIVCPAHKAEYDEPTGTWLLAEMPNLKD